MISLLSGRLLPRPRAVTAAAERGGGGGRSGFSGRSGSSSKRGGGRGGGGKSSRGGGGGGGRGSGGRKDGNFGTNTAAPKKVVVDAADPPEVSNEPSLLSAPMEVVVLERDEAPEAAISPLWDSFCGTSAGGWQGVATAVSPVTGEREAVGLVDARVVVESRDEVADPDDPSVVRSVVRTRTKSVKKDVLALATYTVERRTGGRAGGKGADRLARRTVRSPTTAGLAAVAAAEEEEAGEAGDEEGGEDAVPITSPSSPSFDGVNDALRSKEPGLVIFDGGTCSRGPLNLLGLPPLTTTTAAAGRSGGGRGGGGGGGGGNVGGIDVDAEREALERLVSLSPSTSALGSEGRGKRRTGGAGGGSSDEGDWSSLEGGRGLGGGDRGGNDGGNSENSDGDIEILDIAASPDSGEDPEATVSVIESCLAWGGEQRLRVQLTLSVSDDGDELDITPLRILVTREAWQCLPDGDVAACAVDSPEADGRGANEKASPSSSSSSPSSAPASVITSRSTALSTAAAFEGTWKVFDVCAHAIPPPPSSSAGEEEAGGSKSGGTSGAGGKGAEEAAFDLDDPDEQVTAIYSTSRTVQRWTLDPTEFPGDGGGAYALPDARAAAAEVSARGSDGVGSSPSSSSSGPAPGAALLELVMLDPVSRGADADAIEGMGRWGKGKGEEGGGESDSDADYSPLLRRALLVTALWSPRDGTVVGLQREYDAGGDLVEVRARTAVRTDVAGGSM